MPNSATDIAALASESRSQRVSGSFRDPSGYVFRKGDRVFRAIDAESARTLQLIQDRGLLDSLNGDGLLVRTSFVQNPDDIRALAKENPGYSVFLEHESVERISFPYEWTIGMLADAAICTLELQERLLKEGVSLKDATAYNVQFVRGRPVFLDVSSIETPERRDVWFAMGQFHRMFTYPLILFRHFGWDLRSYFLSSLDGKSVEEVSRVIRGLKRFRPDLLLDFTFPLLMEQKTSQPTERPTQAPARGPEGQLMNLQRLKSKVRALAAGYRPRGHWSSYTRTHTYSDFAMNAKQEMVREWLSRERPSLVLDIGCNTGEFSLIASEAGAEVVAVDGDHDAVELLFRKVREKSLPILPLCMDILNPSPAIGHRNVERSRFHDRVNADCVLALALLHHLMVSGNLPLEEVRDLLWELTKRAVILEFVPPSDPMFRQLVAFRRDYFANLTLERCIGVFSKRFAVEQSLSIGDSGRTLLYLKRRNG